MTSFLLLLFEKVFLQFAARISLFTKISERIKDFYKIKVFEKTIYRCLFRKVVTFARQFMESKSVKFNAL